MTPEIVVEARIADDLAHVEGTVRATGFDGPVAWRDVLTDAPLPATDLLARRAWPDRPARGAVTWREGPDGALAFTTTLPRRWAPNGHARGVIASDGGWLPQPVVDGRAPVATWRVSLTLPDGAVGAIGPAAGTGTLTAAVMGDRVGFRVLTHGVVTRITTPSVQVTYVGRRAPGRWRARVWAEVVDRALRGTTDTLTVAVGPDREQLARATPGLVLASDRLFRVTPTLERFHHRVAAEVIATSVAPVDDPFARAVLGAARARKVAQGWTARRYVQLGSFLPGLEALLYDGRTPYVADLFEEAVATPIDPLAPIAPMATGRLVVAQIVDGWGEPALDAVVAALAAGEDLDAAGLAGGLPPGWLRARARPSVGEDARVTVDAGAVTLVRDAPADAPIAPVRYTTPAGVATWLAGPGEALPLGPIARVTVDPDRHLPQTSRFGDAWPPRWRATVSGWIDTINLTDAYVEASGYAVVRRTDDPDDAIVGVAWTDREQWLGLRVGWQHRMGRPIDGLVRAQRLLLQVGPTVFNPALAATAGAPWALAGSAAWAWDTRVDAYFPLRGHRLSASVDGGYAPTTGASWTSARAGAAIVGSPHPAWAGAARIAAGAVRGDVAHRELALGGRDNLRAIAQSAALGDLRATAFVEGRWAALRNASIPLGAVWLDEIHLSAGVEGGALRVDGAPVGAIGVAGGLLFVGEWLGMAPGAVGFTVAAPVWWAGIADPAPATVYVRWGPEL